MADNDDLLEHHIRERAFQLWQNAGCPDGKSDEFWHLAHEQETQNRLEKPIDLVEEAGGHYPPTGDTQNFA
jgi:hypothetical protein